MANPALQARHWKDIFQLVDQTWSADFPFSLETLLNWDIQSKLEQVCVISSYASKEHSLKTALDAMMEQWKDIEVTVTAFKDSGTFILCAVDDIQLLLDDHLMKMQAMCASSFVKPFQEMANSWSFTMNNLQARYLLYAKHVFHMYSTYSTFSMNQRLYVCTSNSFYMAA